MSTWTTPDPTRYSAGNVLPATDLDNLEGNFQHLANTARFQIDRPSGTLTLTTSYQDVPGVSISLGIVGVWKITGVFSFIVPTGDAGIEMVGTIHHNGTQDTAGSASVVAQHASGNDIRSCTGVWSVTAAAVPYVVKMQAKASSGSGITATVYIVGTSLTAELAYPT